MGVGVTIVSGNSRTTVGLDSSGRPDGWCQTMKHEGGAAVSGEREALDRALRDAKASEQPRLVAGYVRGNTYRAVVCQRLGGTAMRCDAMRWGGDGADAGCHLRARSRSEPGQRDASRNRSIN